MERYETYDEDKLPDDYVGYSWHFFSEDGGLSQKISITDIDGKCIAHASNQGVADAICEAMNSRI